MTKINIISGTKNIDLSLIKSPTQTMTSLEIVQLTNKRHDHIVRDIRNIIKELKMSPDLGSQNYQYAPSAYIDSRGKSQPMFVMNREAVLLLTSGYSILQRAKLINRLKELEEQPLRQLLNQLTLQGRMITNNGSQWGKSGVEQKKAKKVWQIHLDAVINEINQELDLFLTIK